MPRVHLLLANLADDESETGQAIHGLEVSVLQSFWTQSEGKERKIGKARGEGPQSRRGIAGLRGIEQPTAEDPFDVDNVL